MVSWTHTATDHSKSSKKLHHKDRSDGVKDAAVNTLSNGITNNCQIHWYIQQCHSCNQKESRGSNGTL